MNFSLATAFLKFLFILHRLVASLLLWIAPKRNLWPRSLTLEDSQHVSITLLLRKLNQGITKTAHSTADWFKAWKWWWIIEKCGFLLAEERKKQKTFFLHTAGSKGLSVLGSSGHMAFQGSVVLLMAFRHCLTCPALHGFGVFVGNSRVILVG